MIILVVSFKQNLNFKIQMLAENSLISFLNASSEEISTLVSIVPEDLIIYEWKKEEIFIFGLEN